MPKIQEHANTLEAEERGRTFRPHKKSLVCHPIQLKNAMREGGRIFLFFLYIFSFVCPSLAEAYFKVTKQSVN